MDKTISVIVSKCVPNEDRIYGERLVDRKFTCISEARKLAESNLSDCRSVVLRPNYNEVDENGNRYFREWRSFNGEPLREVRFSF